MCMVFGKGVQCGGQEICGPRRGNEPLLKSTHNIQINFYPKQSRTSSWRMFVHVRYQVGRTNDIWIIQGTVLIIVLVSLSQKGVILTHYCNYTKCSVVLLNLFILTSVSVFCKMSLFNLLFFESLKMPGNKYYTLEPPPFIYNFTVSSTFIMTF